MSIYGPPPPKGELRQGELLRNVVEHRPVSAMKADNPGFIPVLHDTVLVLAADCDLLQDYHARFPEHASEKFQQGLKGSSGNKPWLVHHVKLCQVFDEQSIKAITKNPADAIKQARTKSGLRYYGIPEGAVPDGLTLPALVLDFKRTFGMPPEALYAAIESGAIERLGIVQHPYFTDAQQRCLFYEGRLGLE